MVQVLVLPKCGIDSGEIIVNDVESNKENENKQKVSNVTEKQNVDEFTDQDHLNVRLKDHSVRVTK